MHKKAVEFSPINYNLRWLSAWFYRQLCDQTGDNRYKEKALVHYRQALEPAPQKSAIEKEYEQLKGNRIEGRDEL